ncbi:hypothetical protein CFAM422_011755 [Trichoderma lentiforme]|uniref:Uncharacterized protein n=1 Tax=Trichoderma lentiforme TaxID=1567552 RepID=A0A9P4X5X2_9HYPO|nr:hypothetical protein CFAM422_011755 [Trichoderma lentiforme]
MVGCSLPDKVVANIHGRGTRSDLESDKKLDAWRLRQGDQVAKVEATEDYTGVKSQMKDCGGG